MVKIDSSGNFLEDMNTMTTIDNEGNLRYIPMSGRTTQKKKKKDGILDNWVQAPQVFDDGYQFGDVSKTILGTASDIGLGIVQGIVAGGEGIGDLLTYGASGISRLAGNDELADQLKENAKINATEEIFGVVKNRTGLEKASVVGSKGDQVSNAIGTILTLTSTAGLGGAAGLGKTGQTIVSMGSMGASSVGSGMSEAYQGGATDEEAVKYGLISGAAEVGSEMLFGGLGKGAKAVGISQGLTGADDMLAKTISDKFKSQLAKNLAEYTVKAGAEGVEEVISGLAQAWGKKMTYMSEEDLSKLIQDEKLLDQFIVGMVSSGVSQAPGLVKTTSKGQDYLTGYTQNEQKVYDALLQERINEEQSESKKPLTKKQINAIEEEFRQDFENGNISTKKIEEVLGYEDIYNNLKDTTENALAKTLTAQDEAGIREEAKQEYAKRIKDDEFLKKNYYEDTQRTKAYNVDVNQYDKKYRGTIQKAIDSGILNNSTKTHQFVDFISKLAADKGVTFDFTNNEALKNSSLGIDGATVNGYVNANGDITLNINSAKSLNSVVGHEITHVLEGSDLYQALSDSLKEYAETKGEYAKRYNELQELYKNVEGADITKELNADLVGDYLFTNQEFINHLTQNRNLFQRIYDEIKYLVKQATAGSKEARQLLKAQKMFEKAYKDNSVKLAEQEESTQPKYSITQDSNGRELSEQQQEYFKDSKVRDDEGRLIPLYHGTPNDFTIFDTKNFGGKNGTAEGFGIYLTDNIDVADDYLQQDKGKVMELYANITKPATTEVLTVNKQDIIKAIKELTTKEAQQMVNDGEYDTINDALKDTWISNYTYTYDKSIEDSYNDVAKAVLESSENDYEVLQELMNGSGNNDYKNANDFYNIITNTLGFDGIKTKWEFTDNDLKNKNADIWLAFNSNQVKNIDNLNPTENEDIRYSISKNGEDIAPTGDYNIYGEDIELQQTAPIRQDLVNLQNDIAAIKEDYRKQSEDIKKELQALREEREELDRGVNEVAPIDEYTPVESDIAPYESETAYPNTNVVPLDDNELKKYKKYFKDEFKFKGKQLDAAMDGIKELSAKPDLTQNDVYKYFKDNFGKEETKIINDAINEAKSELKYMEIGVSDEIKKDIAYRYEKYGDFRKKNFGKLKLVDYDGTNGVDTRFQELSNMFPDLFNAEETINPADQLMRISEVANDKGYDTYFEELPDELVRAYSDELYSMINDYRNETTQKLAEEQIPLSYLEEIAPTQEEETIDDYYNNLNERITNLETELENIPKREYYDVYNRELEDKLSERIEPEKRDILDLINLENAKKNGKKVELVKPVVAKEKSGLKSAIDFGRKMFTNEFAEISNMARDYNNQKLVHKADMLNNVTGEVQNSITTAQTDFNGNEIENGEALDKIFDELREKGLETVGNDYLINWSNIDRWAKGKGSQTPLDVSQRIVANYEAKYPFLKRWATKVWQYGRNELENKYKAGMLSKKMFEYNRDAYPHYVPFVSDSNNLDSFMGEIKELKVSPIKRAKGGSTELTPIEKALANYTYSGRLAYRNNELYKEIFNTLNPGTTDVRGAEVGDDFFNSNETLYKNDDGYFLTAIFDGEERKTKISKELFETLNRDMKHRVQNVEEKLSTLLKPVQGFSNIRRKILTTWSPTFLVKNVVKDIQDGLFNSKHTKGLVKNYLPGIKELMTRSTPEVRQYLALSGNEALRGDYESNLYQTKKGLKNNKFLKALANMNEIMEQAPRYAEFKASLEAGDTLEQAMYNSREVTTNFARGGVITKALNRNGFTFLNASVQGFDKFIRNFSGENGAKGIANSLLKAVALGVAPAVFNELAFGGLGDDDKDEDYDALPDYIKDNYYLIKTGDGNFVRIPKGRVLSVFGSAARRTIELAEGEEDAFKGYLSNVNNQIGINNPEENNIFSPFLQAFGSENGNAWYGGDIVPSRLQDKPAEEQYDASTDKMSIWLGSHLGISPYKINYLIDQYSGGIGDIVLPMITDEAKSNGNILAPLSDQFTADSTTDNKYVSDFYSKNDELKVKANSSKATDSDLVKNQYMYSVSKQMSELYAERRKVQENNSLTKEQKYEKAQAIKKEINKLAKEGLDTYESGNITGNYAEVGNQEFYKNAKGKWTDVSETDKENINSLGLNNRERDSYFKTSNELYNIDQRYKNLTEGVSEEEKTKYNAQRKVDVINAVKSANLPDEGKAALYDKKYADTDTLNAVLDCNIDFDSYLDLQAQNFTADKDKDGKSISGSKKAKVYGYINSMDMPYEQKIMLAKLEYKSDNTYNNEIINYLNNDSRISYQDMTSILKAMGFKVDEYGNITWE